jgi:hypothetical protein
MALQPPIWKFFKRNKGAEKHNISLLVMTELHAVTSQEKR